MNKGIEKLLRKLVLKKYPVYKDVWCSEYTGAFRVERSAPYAKAYEVFLVILEEDYNNEDLYKGVGEYVEDIAKYMDVKVMGVFNEVVTQEEWEEMSGQKD